MAYYISSGQTSTGITLNDDIMYVMSGGVASSTSVNNWGSMYIDSGGVANSTTINSNGSMYIYSGGTATDIVWTPCIGYVSAAAGAVVTYASSYSGVYFGDGFQLRSHLDTMTGKVLTYDTMYVMSGGVANDTTINSSSYMYISSGGVANSNTVNSRGSMHISSGGVANSTTVNSSGYMYISSGGVANSTWVNSGGYLYISSGGTATDIVWTPCIGYVSAADGAVVTYASSYSGVYFGNGIQLLSHTDTMTEKVLEWHSMYVMSGGVANSIWVDSGGYLYISSGGVANSITVNYDGSMEISSDGVANSTTMSGGYLYIFSGGVANRTTMSRGYMIISSGGVANRTTMSGYMVISSGGVANSTTVDWYGSMHISSGGVANSTTVNLFGSLHISSGGVANSTTVNSGGSMYISSGGVAKGATVNDHGVMRISSGGVVNDAILTGGEMLISSGGLATDITISGGALYISSGGTATDIEWTPCIGHIGAADGAVVTYVSSYSGVYCGYGQQLLSHADTITGKRGMYSTYIMSGGVANDMMVNNGGFIYIFSGGIANDTTVNSQGLMYISSGGVANCTTVSGVDSRGYYGKLHICNGGVANGTILTAGKMYISNGGVASVTIVNELSHLNISSGGVAEKVFANDGQITISSGGYAKIGYNPWGNRGSVTSANGASVVFETIEDVTGIYYGNSSASLVNYWGNVHSGLQIQSGFSAIIYDNGIACATTIENSGHMYISSGGVASVTRVNSWGSMYISSGGVANDTTINTYGRMYISNGGVADVTRVNGWSYLNINSGGVANNTTVIEDGRIYISGGGVASVTRVNSFGSMYISSGGCHKGSLQIENGAVVSAYSGAIIDFTVADRTAEDGYLINDLSKISGAPTYTITVAADQAAGTYKLAQGAGNFTGTISIGNGTVNYGSITINGKDFIYDNRSYSLDNVGGNLTLSILSSPPEVPTAVLNTTDPTNQDVVVTVTYSEDSTIRQYKIGNGAWQDYQKAFSVSDNSTVYFRAENAHGESFGSIIISNIDKIAPTLEISGNATVFANQSITLTATASDGIVEYFDGKKWVKGSTLSVSENGTYRFRVTDAAGNITEKSVLVDKIDPVADSSTTDYVFVNAKYSAKNTGKKQNGVVLVYQQNAFASVDAALQKYPGLTGKLLVITDSNINGNACVDLDVVAGAAILPTIKESAGSYSYKATSAPKGTLTISQDIGSTRFIRFSKVNVYDAEVGTISGGKSSSSETWTETLKKGVFSEKEKFSCSFSTAGNITIQSGASLDQLDGFSKVVISESSAGTVTAFHCKDSRSKTATYDDTKHTVSRKITLSNQQSASGTLTVTDSLLGAVTGFATVTLKNSAVSGDLRRVDANGNPYSTVKETYNVKTNKDGSVSGTYSKTETFARSGKLTAQNSVVGNIENFSTVTLDHSCAGNISNIRDSKVVTSGTALWRNVAEYGKPDGYDLDLDAFFLSSTVTSSLNGAVTLKNGALASGIANFKTVSMAASTVEMISNVNKVTVSAGESTIGTYIGTDSSDTLSIAKGAVLCLHALDLGAGAKDTVSVAGTLILTGTDYKNATFAGKGVVAANSAVCAQLNLANEINLGETANGFRGVDVENSDDLLGQAALWNGEGELTGWLGSWSGYASGKDTVDYLKFSAQAGDKVQISGLDAADWTLLDLKGNEISSIAADGTYFLKLEHDEADSVSYAIQLA